MSIITGRRLDYFFKKLFDNFAKKDWNFAGKVPDRGGIFEYDFRSLKGNSEFLFVVSGYEGNYKIYKTYFLPFHFLRDNQEITLEMSGNENMNITYDGGIKIEVQNNSYASEIYMYVR